MASEDNNGLPVVRRLDPELNKSLLKDFNGQRKGFFQVGVNQTLLPYKYEQCLKDIYNFQVRADDTWVITFPRSGTTMTQELVWLVSNDLDFNKARELSMSSRFPHLEMDTVFDDEVIGEFFADNADSPQALQTLNKLFCILHLKFADKMPSPRFIKCHLHFDLLPKDLLTCGAKVIYVARHPKDVAVSYYHLSKTFKCLGYEGDFSKFWDYFEKDLTMWSPYWPHVIGGWDRRMEPNLLFLFYEDLNKDLKTTISKISKFLCKTITDSHVLELLDHLKFENFKNNPSVNAEGHFKLKTFNSNGSSFIRKGKVGGWEDEFTPELSQRADEWIKKHLENTDMRFPK